MKKIGIITIIDNNNYGNRLQNYALQEYLKKMNCHVVTLKNDKYFNHKVNITKQINFLLRYFKNKIKSSFEIKKGRKENFKEFNKHIVFNKKLITTHNQEINQEYDYFIVGSDQVWKPNYLRLSDIDLLAFADNDKRISYAASFGVNKVSKEYENKIKKEIPKFKKISVREEEGKHIIELLTKREDVEVLIDPTMLLTDKEWDKVMQKPKKVPDKKYILNYFLGELSEQKKQEINRVAKEQDCEIINILDKNSEYYLCGPSEFLYLEKNAFLICTDSFHSSVFAILFNRPFLIFDREDTVVNMSSRIDTLINKFNLKNRRYTGTIIEANLKQDYNETYIILEKERQKSKSFLEQALNIK